MNEAIKGQDKLKLAVEKLEAEIFKDWPAKNKGVRLSNGAILLGKGTVLEVKQNEKTH